MHLLRHVVALVYVNVLEVLCIDLDALLHVLLHQVRQVVIFSQLFLQRRKLVSVPFGARDDFLIHVLENSTLSSFFQ